MGKAADNQKRYRENKKAVDAFWEKFGPPPDYVEKILSGHSNLQPNLSLSSEYRAASNSVVHDLSHPDSEPEHDYARHKRNNKKSQASRRQAAEEDANELKRRYPKQWGKRGGAGMIIHAEHRLVERGEALRSKVPSDETLRRWMKEWP